MVSKPKLPLLILSVVAISFALLSLYLYAGLSQTNQTISELRKDSFTDTVNYALLEERYLATKTNRSVGVRPDILFIPYETPPSRGILSLGVYNSYDFQRNFYVSVYFENATDYDGNPVQANANDWITLNGWITHDTVMSINQNRTAHFTISVQPRNAQGGYYSFVSAVCVDEADCSLDSEALYGYDRFVIFIKPFPE